jgi:hypothetical protein
MKFEMDDIYDQVNFLDETFQLKLNIYKLFTMFILSYTNLYLKWHLKKNLWIFIPHTLLEILSFATSHYATGMQLVIVCNYFGHVCNYKFDIV